MNDNVIALPVKPRASPQLTLAEAHLSLLPGNVGVAYFDAAADVVITVGLSPLLGLVDKEPCTLSYAVSIAYPTGTVTVEGCEVYAKAVAALLDMSSLLSGNQDALRITLALSSEEEEIAVGTSGRRGTFRVPVAAALYLQLLTAKTHELEHLMGSQAKAAADNLAAWH